MSRSFNWPTWACGARCQQQLFWKKRVHFEPVRSALWLTVSFQSQGVPLLPLTPFAAPCLPFLIPQPRLPSVRNIFRLWTVAGLYCRHYIWAKLNTLFIPTEKENPYEDVDLKRKSLGRKSCLLESSRSWTTMDRKLNSPPQVCHACWDPQHCFSIVNISHMFSCGDVYPPHWLSMLNPGQDHLEKPCTSFVALQETWYV